jgi:hypothetical protein
METEIMSLAFKLPAALPTPYGCNAAPITSNTARRPLLGRLSRLRPRNPWRGRRQRRLLESHTRDYADTAPSLQETAVAEDPEVSCILAFNDLLAAHIRGDKKTVSQLVSGFDSRWGLMITVKRPWTMTYSEFPGVSG